MRRIKLFVTLFAQNRYRTVEPKLEMIMFVCCCRGGGQIKKPTGHCSSYPNLHNRDAYASSPAPFPHDAEQPKISQKFALKQWHGPSKHSQRTDGSLRVFEKLVAADTDLLEAESRLEGARLKGEHLQEAVKRLDQARSEKERLVDWTQKLVLEVLYIVNTLNLK